VYSIITSTTTTIDYLSLLKKAQNAIKQQKQGETGSVASSNSSTSEKIVPITRNEFEEKLITCIGELYKDSDKQLTKQQLEGTIKLLAMPGTAAQKGIKDAADRKRYMDFWQTLASKYNLSRPGMYAYVSRPGYKFSTSSRQAQRAESKTYAKVLGKSGSTTPTSTSKVTITDKVVAEYMARSLSEHQDIAHLESDRAVQEAAELMNMTEVTTEKWKTAVKFGRQLLQTELQLDKETVEMFDLSVLKHMQFNYVNFYTILMKKSGALQRPMQKESSHDIQSVIQSLARFKTTQPKPETNATIQPLSDEDDDEKNDDVDLSTLE
jgi:hypothetical protein